MAVRAFHPILAVAGPYAERAFFALFGFETVYEGTEFPGLLANRVWKRPLRPVTEQRPIRGWHISSRWQLII